MATEFMSSTSSSSYLVDYLSPDLSDLPPIDHSQDPFQSPMSPVQSAASTPPLSTQHPTSNNHPQMASFATPVSLSSAPYSMPIPAFPRRAEHSYAQNNYLPHPYTMGAPPPPPAAQRPRGPQLPSASLLQPQQSTYVPDVPSSAPDAPPSGSGGSRKRPKYTRSKKGCLTCRSKKIKCDERKPLCTRCEHGHRECTWPETVLPRRPKGAVRGVGNEDDEEEDDERRGSIPGSAVSSHFPSSTTSTHFPGIVNNSPFETAPRRDAFESDGYTNGSQFPLPLANARPFYPRAPGSAPSGDYYPVTTVNGQPIDEYEFPPRQTFGAGSSSGSAAAPRGPYSNGSLYATGPPGSVPSYNGDMRRASWDSSAPTDGRRPSWDNNSLAVSSASSPASSALGLGLGGVARGGGGGGGATSAGSSTGGNGGSASGAAPGSGLMLFQSPDPLSPFFRSVQERNLIKHYCHSSANIIMALPPTPNPILAVTLPIVLDKPPGTHAPTEALRLALLGVGAVHMAYLSSRRRVCVGVGAVGPADDGMVPVVSPMGVSSDLVGGESDAARLMGLSSMLRLGATRCLAVACRNPEETRSDAALGATMAVTLIDIFSGGHQWTRNINLAKTLIALRGGPAAILNTSLPKQARFGGGVTVSPARFWLEMLAVYETFGSLTSGEEPTLLAPGNNDWWFDDAHHTYHANSIEKVFGMARSMVTLIAKVSAFLCRTIRERAVITEAEPEEGASIIQVPDLVLPTMPEDIDMAAAVGDISGDDIIPDFDFDKFLNDFGATPGALGDGFITGPSVDTSGAPAAALTPRFEDLTNAQIAGPSMDFTQFTLPEQTQGEDEGNNNPTFDQVKMATLRAFFQDAKALFTEVESWEDPVGHESREARVLVGNKTHKLALLIIMLRDVFHVPRTDLRVQSYAASILDLCLESSQQNMGVDLTWPVIIAGCQVVTSNARLQVAQAFDSFRKQCCFEIESSERIVAEVWRRVDNNEPRDDWRAVVEDEGLRILVL